jgi:diguanylate cyclase (GGDEF)-like protein
MILYVVLDRFVLSRISRLNQQVRNIRGDLQTPGSIKLGGQDELANLAKSINKMLERQGTFQKQLHKAKQYMETVNRELAAANQELERLAKTDGLTQVMNRHFFQINLEEIWQEGLKNRSPVSLILCDVDFFKLYNDSYGHLAGDLCLQKVAKAMKEAASIEPRAIVARYGGEEFVVILPQVEVNRAIEVAEKMRSTVSHLKLPHRASKVADHVTLSIGVCTLIPKSDLSSRDLIGQADQHLYQAKASGRNQVVAEGSISLVK